MSCYPLVWVLLQLICHLQDLLILLRQILVFQDAGLFGVMFHYGLSFWNILPPIIFLGIGSLTDFGPVIANPKTLILGAAAQIGIFMAFWGAFFSSYIGMDFGINEAASIGIIGGADGQLRYFCQRNLHLTC
ncbi:MAG: hypothetical protein CM1200mP3_07550 [Chloroflexota bacterium]|nr:MAG: hypothetical protein CM1200mP3_07550 [Chloroflexota bacterium]